VTVDPHPEQLSEEQLVALAERALAILHTRYSDEQTLVARFGMAAADDVRLALENAREGFDRFIDHYRETDARPGSA
jgi:hypothetical protein